MERSSKNKLKNFQTALITFENSLKIDLTSIDGIQLDTIKSGQIQKFEYCCELCWKTVKEFLYDFHGIDINSPKQSFKEFYKLNYLNEIEYEKVIEMINDRNRLSHIYNEIFFEDIHKKLKIYFELMKEIYSIVSTVS